MEGMLPGFRGVWGPSWPFYHHPSALVRTALGSKKKNRLPVGPIFFGPILGPQGIPRRGGVGEIADAFFPHVFALFAFFCGKIFWFFFPGIVFFFWHMRFLTFFFAFSELSRFPPQSTEYKPTTTLSTQYN